MFCSQIVHVCEMFFSSSLLMQHSEGGKSVSPVKNTNSL